jgi:hypothetical protein
MPLVILPLADVLSPVRPSVGSMAVFLIVSIVALIASAIGPRIYPLAMLLVIQPLSLVLFTIRPGADTRAFDSTVDPPSLVNLSSCVVIGPLAISPTLLEHSFVFIAITVHFYP